MPPKDKTHAVRIFLDDWLHKAFKLMVTAEGVSMTQWVADKIQEAVIAKGYGKPPNHAYNSIAELVQVHWEVLSQTSISAKNLKAYQEGAKPTELDLVRMAAALDLSEESLVELCHRSFPNGYKKEKEPNGAI